MWPCLGRGPLCGEEAFDAPLRLVLTIAGGALVAAGGYVIAPAHPRHYRGSGLKPPPGVDAGEASLIRGHSGVGAEVGLAALGAFVAFFGVVLANVRTFRYPFGDVMPYHDLGYFLALSGTALLAGPAILVAGFSRSIGAVDPDLRAHLESMPNRRLIGTASLAIGAMVVGTLFGLSFLVATPRVLGISESAPLPIYTSYLIGTATVALLGLLWLASGAELWRLRSRGWWLTILAVVALLVVIASDTSRGFYVGYSPANSADALVRGWGWIGMGLSVLACLIVLRREFGIGAASKGGPSRQTR